MTKGDKNIHNPRLNLSTIRSKKAIISLIGAHRIKGAGGIGRCRFLQLQACHGGAVFGVDLVRGEREIWVAAILEN